MAATGGDGSGDGDGGGAAAMAESRVVKWARPPTYGAPPPARGGHTLSIVGNLAVAFGGTFLKDNKFQLCSDLWALDVETMRWHSPMPGGSRTPAARYGHAAAVVDFRIYVFGGKGSDRLHNDLWCLNVETWTWELVPSASAAPPAPRFGHTMIAVGSKLVVYGGWDGKACNNELWLYDLATFAWVRPPTTGLPTSPRHGHSAVLDDVAGRMIVFGGWHQGADGVPVYQKDVRELNLRSLAWVRTRVGGEYPGPRYAHAVTTVGNVMVTIGGWDGPRDDSAATAAGAEGLGSITIPYTSGMGGDALAGPGSTITVPYGRHVDTYFLDMESDEWVQPMVAGKPPGYRYGSAAVATGAQILVWGGWEGGRALNDLVVLDLSGLTSPAPAGDGGSGDGGGASAGAGAGAGGDAGGGVDMAAYEAMMSGGGGGGGDGDGGGEGEGGMYLGPEGDDHGTGRR